MPKRDFLKAYCSSAYIYPGFHPDCIEAWTGPREILRIAKGAWRRAEEGALNDNELYPYQATNTRIVQESRLERGKRCVTG